MDSFFFFYKTDYDRQSARVTNGPSIFRRLVTRVRRRYERNRSFAMQLHNCPSSVVEFILVYEQQFVW